MNEQIARPQFHHPAHSDRDFTIRRSQGPAVATMPASPLEVTHVEFIQSVQDKINSVPLSAGKDTLVRVYLNAGKLPDGLAIHGELGIRKPGGGGEVFVPAMAAQLISPGQRPGLRERRRDFAGSLNFLLPPSVTSGRRLMRISRLTAADGTQLPVVDSLYPMSFARCAPLRIKAVGLRYAHGGKTHTPTADDFASLRSYLARAYPSAAVIWSQIVVDADFRPPFNEATSMRANAQLAAIRNRDVTGGTDIRTHYYGLVSDAGGEHFMRGRANSIPATPGPNAVASGPAGIEQLPSGMSASFAGWYGAHELGHTFGRYHPGFPPPEAKGGQDRSDTGFPYPHGSLSTEEDDFVAFDRGEPALGVPMRIIPGDKCFDVMTYLENLWVSAYTLEAIRRRLNEESLLGGS